MIDRTDKTRWLDPVTVKLPSGIPRIFNNVADALDFLEFEWPNRNGKKYQRAVEACGRAIQHQTPPAVAKTEFLLACIEAGMPPIQIDRGPKGRIVLRSSDRDG